MLNDTHFKEPTLFVLYISLCIVSYVECYLYIFFLYFRQKTVVCHWCFIRDYFDYHFTLHCFMINGYTSEYSWKYLFMDRLIHVVHVLSPTFISQTHTHTLPIICNVLVRFLFPSLSFINNY